MSRTRLALAAVMAAGMIGIAHAEEAGPLTVAELSRCAQQVQQLRAESARLLDENARLDAQRESIQSRQLALQTEADALDRTDVQTGLALHDRRARMNEEAVLFNARIEQIRQEIAELNAVRNDYDRGCSQRPYKRKDLEQLPQAAQDAMRTGLGDVEVPYVPRTQPTSSPSE